MADEQTPEVIPNAEVRQWGMLCHLVSLVGCFIPFASVIGVLLVWLLKRDLDPFVDDQGKESLNFQITMLLVAIPCFVLMLVFIGFLLIGILCMWWFVFTIIASARAYEGQRYRYPLTLRLIS